MRKFLLTMVFFVCITLCAFAFAGCKTVAIQNEQKAESDYEDVVPENPDGEHGVDEEPGSEHGADEEPSTEHGTDEEPNGEHGADEGQNETGGNGTGEEPGEQGNAEEPAHEHSISQEWSSDSITHWHECDGCDERIDEEPHDWDDGVVVDEATCTESGTILYTCKKCLSKKYRTIFPTGHSLVHHEAKDPTELEDGNIEFWQCLTCGKYFADENGQTEIKEQDTIVPATGIDYSKRIQIVMPTFYEQGHVLVQNQEVVVIPSIDDVPILPLDGCLYEISNQNLTEIISKIMLEFELDSTTAKQVLLDLAIECENDEGCEEKVLYYLARLNAFCFYYDEFAQ